MRTRQFCPIVVVCLAALAAGVSCSSDRPLAGSEVTQTGTLNMPLETFSESGTRYLLVNATFEVVDVRSGRTEEVLSGDDDVFSSQLSAEIDAGNYTVRLVPGWRIERIDDFGGDFGGGFGGGFGGSFGGGASQTPGTSTPVPGPTAAPPSLVFDDDVVGGPIDTDDVLDDVLDDAFGEVDGGSFPQPTGTATSTSPPSGQTGSSGGTAGGGTGVFGSFGEIMNSQLASDAIQFASIFANQDTFLTYTFLVGDDLISFDPGRLHIGIEVIETDPGSGNDICDNPTVARRPALMETSDTALQFVSLRGALDAIASNGGFDAAGEDLYHQIIDSYATADQGRMTGTAHCGDETTNGSPSLNGYPILCNRAEAQQFDNLDFWFPMAIVNRIDLAPQNGAHCGQQRIVFGNNVQGRMFFIVEAQIPNPAPELGINGCTPLAEFWAGLTQLDAQSRGIELSQAFLSGHPTLQEAGFSPFYTALNFTVGTGQIRTNNFDTGIWTLREFKLAAAEGDVAAIPFPTAEAPNGALWDDGADLPQGPGCREAFINESLAGVLGDDPAQFSFIVPQECKDAESENSFTQAYANQLSNGSPNGFRADLQAALEGTNLTPEDVATRAQFAGSCIGCHNEASGAFLGTGSDGLDDFAPFSNDFVHVQEFTEPCPDGESGQCHALSPAVVDLFLPHRLQVMENLVSVPMPPQCGGDGDGGITPPPPPPLVDGGVIVFPEFDSGAVDAGAAFEPELPSADTPTEVLLAVDEEARDGYGAATIGGQSARQTH